MNQLGLAITRENPRPEFVPKEANRNTKAESFVNEYKKACLLEYLITPAEGVW